MNTQTTKAPQVILGTGPLALLAWVGANHCTVVGPMRELHLSGLAHQAGRFDQPASLEMQVPIKRLNY